MAAAFITSLFSCPDSPPPSSAVTAAGTPVPSPKLANFIAYAFHRTRLSSSVTFASLFLLQRLKARFPAARGSSGHRLFISAFMIASKVVCDDTYSNKSWCVVGQGMFSLREINQMEREMCGYLEWVLNVQHLELEQFTEKVQLEFGSGVAPKTASKPIPAHAPSFKKPAEDVDQIPAASPSRQYPSPTSAAVSPDSEPESPSHSDTTSPTSSAPQTPPQDIEDGQPQVVSASTTSIPNVMKTGGPVESKHTIADSERPFAFAAPAVW